MTEKNPANDEDNEPINILAELPANELNDEVALEDIDLLLAEDDPDFLRQIAEIKINPNAVNLSVMDDAISAISIIEQKIKWNVHFWNLFSLKNDPKKVITFWALVVTCAFMVFFGFKIIDVYLSKGLFLHSYAELGPVVHSYNPLNEVEPFYDNPRFAKNIMTMTKMFANLKASKNSGSNPMLALEISVEGMSAESIIEIKDREAEFKDFLLRESEEFSYDELISVEGKKELLEKYQVVLNSNLTQGQIRRVLLKSFIIKP